MIVLHVMLVITRIKPCLACTHSHLYCNTAGPVVNLQCYVLRYALCLRLRITTPTSTILTNTKSICWTKVITGNQELCGKSPKALLSPTSWTRHVRPHLLSAAHWPLNPAKMGSWPPETTNKRILLLLISYKSKRGGRLRQKTHFPTTFQQLALPMSSLLLHAFDIFLIILINTSYNTTLPPDLKITCSCNH